MTPDRADPVALAEFERPVVTLRSPFPPSQVGKLPKKNVDLDYVGHGAVTDRLLTVDPEWNWEPMALTPDGLPLFDYDSNGQTVGLWIKLTVCGVTRLGYGDCLPGQFNSEKVLIGDALRNAAMRFGVALDLWIKGHAEDDEKVSAGDDRQRAPRKPPKAPEPPPLPPEVVELREALAASPEATQQAFVAKFGKTRELPLEKVGEAARWLVTFEPDALSPDPVGAS